MFVRGKESCQDGGGAGEKFDLGEGERKHSRSCFNLDVNRSEGASLQYIGTNVPLFHGFITFRE